MAGVIQGSGGGAGNVVHPASIQGNWVVANTDLQTADSATNLLKPQLISRAAFSWVEVPWCATRVLVRGRNLAAMSAAGTPAAVIRLIGASGTPTRTSGSTVVWSAGPSAGGSNVGEFIRLDNADANATGLTLTFATTGNLEDDLYEYTDLPSLAGYDLQGCQWVGVAVETACAVTGSAAVDAMLKFLN